MYTNDYGEKIAVGCSEYSMLTTDTKTYDMISRVINPFDLNITKNNPYTEKEKNKSCFLEIKTNDELILVVLKTEKEPDFTEYYEMYYNDSNDYEQVNKILNFHLINQDNQLVLMYGTSIMILDINTFEVLKYTSSDYIKDFGVKLTYQNNTYIVEDYKKNLTFFDENLDIIR